MYLKLFLAGACGCALMSVCGADAPKTVAAATPAPGGNAIEITAGGLVRRTIWNRSAGETAK